MKTAWLNRRVAASGPYLALCLSAKEFTAALNDLRYTKSRPEWLGDKSGMTHTFEHERSGIVCIVCLQVKPGVEPIQIAALLVHEAVHVWQQYLSDIGERSPGDEMMAYGVQSIAQELLYEYARRLKRKR